MIGKGSVDLVGVLDAVFDQHRSPAHKSAGFSYLVCQNRESYSKVFTDFVGAAVWTEIIKDVRY